jgi:hypothetical protein
VGAAIAAVLLSLGTGAAACAGIRSWMTRRHTTALVWAFTSTGLLWLTFMTVILAAWIRP